MVYAIIHAKIPGKVREIDKTVREATFALIGMIAMRTQFDEMHQKRLFVLHLENITSQEGHLHLAAADGALGFELLVQDIVNDSGATDVAPISVHREWMSRPSLL
ncbi:uncharacterized protein LACBIDRAFT_308354 [Laccaria bicolor S238N-H82]|uniref:Predicted protein n=1 Tax=Laccaria bicolor (strain S238N-H82 / ATCC MYA-4686) TaxID=486041 RepID=B0DS55_LACBS|nr:uncharacterized protein LACBIDRAFT_308354 [Laccaria bicolor S238N-H82]EDR02640.1 predicted protein [Laccaria bicolor S238N-H82]|eukprot:XP_001886684.1 predicted protein [Laccaria bicolor S238N-H82]